MSNEKDCSSIIHHLLSFYWKGPLLLDRFSRPTDIWYMYFTVIIYDYRQCTVYSMYIYIYITWSQPVRSIRAGKWMIDVFNFFFARISAMVLAHLKVNLAILESEASQMSGKESFQFGGSAVLATHRIPNQNAKKNSVIQKSVYPFLD